MDQLTADFAWDTQGEDEDILVPDSPWEASFGLDEAGGDPVEDDWEDNRPAAPMEIDFDDPVSEHLLNALRRAARDACNVNSRDEARKKALRWMFVPGAQDREGLDFEHACLALQARPNVFRSRAVLQMWRAGVVLEDPLPIESVPLPSDFESEVMARVGFGLPVDLAHAIWSWPSIMVFDLMQRFEGQDISKALRALDAEGLVAVSQMRLYYVARNPDTLPIHLLRRFSFAKSLHIAY